MGGNKWHAISICFVESVESVWAFFEKSVREGGVIIFVKKWVLIGFLMD